MKIKTTFVMTTVSFLLAGCGSLDLQKPFDPVGSPDARPEDKCVCLASMQGYGCGFMVQQDGNVYVLTDKSLVQNQPVIVMVDSKGNDCIPALTYYSDDSPIAIVVPEIFNSWDKDCFGIDASNDKCNEYGTSELSGLDYYCDEDGTLEIARHAASSGGNLCLGGPFVDSKTGLAKGIMTTEGYVPLSSLNLDKFKDHSDGFYYPSRVRAIRRHGVSVVEENPQEAFNCIAYSAVCGDIRATIALQEMFLCMGYHFTAPKNPQLCVLRIMSYLDIKEGQYELATYLEEGEDELAPNKAAAIKWYEKAAAKGCEEAAERLAKLKNETVETGE